MNTKDKIVLALDTSCLDEVKSLVSELKDYIGVFKVGKQLFTKYGPKIVEYIHAQEGKVFLDLKYHDIPNTVANAGISAAELGVFMFNVHASGGREMMLTTNDKLTEFCLKKNLNKPITLAVTVLTSISQEILTDQLRVNSDINEHIKYLAKLTKESGFNGVVCSPKEITMIKEVCGKGFIVLTPGIRPVWASTDDQKRITTPEVAIKQGADFIVIGRPITKAENKVEAAKKILAEIDS